MFTKFKIGFFILIISCYYVFGQGKTLKIGDTAPNFNLVGTDDNHYTLESFSKADILVVIFMANHCPTSQAYQGRIIKLAKDYKDKGVAVVGISSNNPEALRLDEYGYSDIGDSFKEMKQRVKEKHYNFPYLYDGDKQLAASAYGAIATPHLFIFDKNRKLRYVGRFDDGENIKKIKNHDALNAIDALLAGKKVPVEKTKTFGCSIKWKSKKVSAQKTLAKMNAEPVSLDMIDLDGVKEIITNKSKKLLLINFWATWCPPCAAEFPELVHIYRNYRKRNFDMITISMNKVDKNEQVLKFLKNNFASNKNYQFKSDDKYGLINSVDADWPGSLPYTILVKPGGKIIYKKLGIIDSKEVRKKIIEYLGRYWETL